MGDSKGVIDVNFPKRGKFLSKLRVVCLFAGMEAKIFKKKKRGLTLANFGLDLIKIGFWQIF